MFNEQVGGQIAWLLPLAAVSLVAGLWLTRRAPRTDLRRAGFVLFGVWALVHVAVFSTQQGIFHPYYVSALAPAVAALGRHGLVTLARSALGGSLLAVDDRRHRVARGRAARPHGGLRAVAARRDPGRRGARDRRAAALRPRSAAALAVAGRGRRVRAVRRPGGLHGRQRRPRAERQQRAGRAVERVAGRDGRRAGRRRAAAAAAGGRRAAERRAAGAAPGRRPARGRRRAWAAARRSATS